MSPKIIIIAAIVLVVIGGIAFYALRPAPVAEMPAGTTSGQAAQAAPSSIADDERELSAIPVDDLGKEMRDINAEIAK